MHSDMHTEKRVIARFTPPPLIRATYLNDWPDLVDSIETTSC